MKFILNSSSLVTTPFPSITTNNKQKLTKVNQSKPVATTASISAENSIKTKRKKQVSHRKKKDSKGNNKKGIEIEKIKLSSKSDKQAQRSRKCDELEKSC